MKIFKVINNNIVITLDQNNQEIILMGRGLGSNNDLEIISMKI